MLKRVFFNNFGTVETERNATTAFPQATPQKNTCFFTMASQRGENLCISHRQERTRKFLILRSQFQLSYISTVSLIFSPASFHLYISQGAVTKPLRIRVKHPFFFLTDSNPNGGYSTCSNRLPSLPHFNIQTHKARTEWLKAGYLF